MAFLAQRPKFLIILTIICVSAGAAKLSTSPPDDSEAMGKAAVLAFATNIHSFSYYQCRYRYTRAQAKSVEDGIRGKFTNSISYDNRLLVDGDKDLYEALAPAVPPNLRQAQLFPGKKGLLKVPALTSSDRYLADGKSVINYSPQLGSLGLWSKAKGTRKIEHTPLGFEFVGHRSSHGPDVLMAQSDTFQMSSDGLSEIDGRPVVKVRFKDRRILRLPEGPLETSLVYAFDLGRGNLPIRVTMLWNNKAKSQVFITDVRECSDQRWFPERVIDIVTPDKAGALFDVSEIKLLELDADRRPAAADFVITVPAGTAVSDQNSVTGSFRLKQEEKIHIEDISSLFALLERTQVNPLVDTEVHQPNSYRWIWVVAGVGVAGSGVFILLRRRRRAMSASL